jgi:exodeoxyribonuclease-1
VNSSTSFYWHDYETFGTDPKRDQASQFAGVRTDENLEIMGEPLMIYCQPNADCLPHPEACLLTNISPLKAKAEGLKEKDFIARIYYEMAQPNTCSVGYNSIRFDDEVTRHTLYRNFYDPYQREYMNGNSRWDIIDLVRMTYALRPEGINWPKNEEGLPSFKLELLTKANGIGHEAAHDALSDVIATIEFAKLIKRNQPRLFSFYLDLRKKQKAFDILNSAYNEAVIHISSKYPATQNCLAPVMAICPEPKNSNGVVVCDLSKNLEQLIELDADTLRTKLYTKSTELAEGEERPPIKTVHANKSPALAPLKTLRDEDKKRLKIDFKQIEENQSFVKKNAKALKEKVTQILSESNFKDSQDPELMLYSGSFFSPKDRNKMQTLINKDGAGLKDDFEDSRVAEMLFRYRARNFPESLNTEEEKIWKEFCKNKLLGEQETSSISLEDYSSKLVELRESYSGQSDKLELIDDMETYGKSLS